VVVIMMMIMIIIIIPNLNLRWIEIYNLKVIKFVSDAFRI